MAKTESKTPAGATVHNLTVTLGGVLLLKEVLPAQGWYADTKGNLDLRAYEVTESISSVVDPLTITDANALFDLKLTEAQRDAVKTCLRFFRRKGAFSVTKHVLSLYTAFGVVEE